MSLLARVFEEVERSPIGGLTGRLRQDLVDPAHYEANKDNWTATTYRSIGWACPPKDYGKWHDLVYNLVRHCLERYGEQEITSWYWELWNEPDLDYYWLGTIEEYNQLYDYSAAALKAISPHLRVGGPGTTNPMQAPLNQASSTMPMKPIGSWISTGLTPR